MIVTSDRTFAIYTVELLQAAKLTLNYYHNQKSMDTITRVRL